MIRLSNGGGSIASSQLIVAPLSSFDANKNISDTHFQSCGWWLLIGAQLNEQSRFDNTYHRLFYTNTLIGKMNSKAQIRVKTNYKKLTAIKCNNKRCMITLAQIFVNSYCFCTIKWLTCHYYPFRSSSTKIAIGIRMIWFVCDCKLRNGHTFGVAGLLKKTKPFNVTG